MNTPHERPETCVRQLAGGCPPPSGIFSGHHHMTEPVSEDLLHRMGDFVADVLRSDIECSAEWSDLTPGRAGQAIGCLPRDAIRFLMPTHRLLCEIEAMTTWRATWPDWFAAARAALDRAGNRETDQRP